MNKADYFIPHYLQQCKSLKLKIDSEIADDIKHVEVLSKDFRVANKGALELDRAVSTILKEMVDEKREEIREMEEGEAKKRQEIKEAKDKLIERARAVGITDEDPLVLEVEKREKEVEALNRRAKQVGLPEGTPLKQIEAKEEELLQKKEDAQNKKDQEEKYRKDQAKLLGLSPDATVEEIQEARKKRSSTKELNARARNVGLPAGSTQEEIEQAEEILEAEALELGMDGSSSRKQVDKRKRELASKKRAERQSTMSKDELALEALFDAGHTEVTPQDLKSAGFNTSPFGKLTSRGCKVGNYKLNKGRYSIRYTLTKVS